MIDLGEPTNSFEKELFSRDSKGKVKYWKVTVEELNNGNALLTTFSGTLLGKHTPSPEEIKEGKNQGKANETTPYTQAVSEAEGKINKKLREGYKEYEYLPIITLEELNNQLLEFLPQENTDKDGNLKPMKAQPFYKDNGEIRINFPCYAQPKLNGFRCVARIEPIEGSLFPDEKRVVLRSKNGLEYPALVHIIKQLSHELFTINGKEVIFDGEIFVHDHLLQEISSAARKTNTLTPYLEFHIFDLSIPKLTQEERFIMLEQVNLSGASHVHIVANSIIENAKEAEEFVDECIEEGYEGGIFRDKYAVYGFGKRVSTMVKLKRIKDGEFVIKDIITDNPDFPERCVLVCHNDLNDKIFKTTPEGTHEYRTELYNNKEKYIGKKATVRYFERTEDDIPFHSNAIIRDYE